jgi:uncharacterized protein (TIGR00255 family)
MIKSMTGFGQASFDDGQIQINVELKTLNSKFLDLSLRIPRVFSDKELEVRNLISEKLERGKISLAIEFLRYGQNEIKQSYNEDLFVIYYSRLKKLADRVYAPLEGLFELALNSPDVIQNKLGEQTNEEEWLQVRNALLEAVKKCESFRLDEGKVLEKKFEEYCQAIQSSLSKIEELDTKRIEKIRHRLKENIVSFFGEEGYDINRLEQEIIFYIEKLDIHEERVRLATHLDYFLQILREPQSNGKKLAFIAQEIGREINTIGSKANDASIQKHVVDMKEELEKIKEQLNNVL